MKNEKKDLMTVKEAAAFLKINEKKLYTLLNQGKVPGTKVTGKWILPSLELERYIEAASRDAVKWASRQAVHERRHIVVCGSDDPVLSMAQGAFHVQRPEFILLSSSVGSAEGLRLLGDGMCDVALSHLYDDTAGDFTFPFLPDFFEGTDDVVLVNLFHRRVGFVSRSGRVHALENAVKKGMRLVNRQRGSGVRALLDSLVSRSGLDPTDIPGYGDEVFTHLDVAGRIASGRADYGLAVESAAALAGMCFEHVFEERFDMVVKKDVFFEPKIQALVEFIRSDAFRDLTGSMRGYSTRDTGRIMYPKGARVEQGQGGAQRREDE